MAMKVKLWGVRGSIPAPVLPNQMEEKVRDLLTRYEGFRNDGKGHVDEFLDQLPLWEKKGFGGNTACCEVLAGDQQIIIDGGSGIRKLGESMLAGPCGKGQGKVHILFTHFHWDHIIGLPFFVPFFIPGNEIHCYAVSEGMEESIRKMFSKPNFPVPFERLGAKIHFHQIEGRKPMKFGDLEVTPYQLDHPDPCWGYRFEKDGKTMSYCVDTEGTRVSRADLGPDLPLYEEIDLMIFDAQYTFLEATEKIDWGHATAPIGLDLAIREKIKRLIFIHHDPIAPDAKVAEAEEQTRVYYEQKMAVAKQMGTPFFEVDWEFAIEGNEYDL